MVRDISGAADSNIAFLKGSRLSAAKGGVKFWCGAGVGARKDGAKEMEGF